MCRYCQNLTNFFTCDGILSPIYTECYNADQRLTQTIQNNYLLRGLNFLCENNAEGAIKLINGEVIECVNSKQAELAECLKPFMELQPQAKRNGDNFGKPSDFCR